MEFLFPNMADDSRTRKYMLEELTDDILLNRIEENGCLNSAGRRAWPSLLQEALGRHSPKWLEMMINRPEYCTNHQASRPKGTTIPELIPTNSIQGLCEQQFVQYYFRALARRATDDGRSLRVARLKTVEPPDSITSHFIGAHIDPELFLVNLRSSKSIEKFLGIRSETISGLGVVIAD